MANKIIFASGDTQPGDITATAPVEFDTKSIEAAQADPKKLPTFFIRAYGGGKLVLNGYDMPVVLDLDGIEPRRRQIPIHADHDQKKLVAHANDFEHISNDAINLRGVMSGTGKKAREIRANVANGVEYQASIGARPKTQPELVERGSSASVNGRKQDGPFYRIRKSLLFETSFVTVGADETATATVAATAVKKKDKRAMDFEKWVLSEFGLNASELSDDQRKKLEARHQRETAEADNASQNANTATQTATSTAEPVAASAGTQIITAGGVGATDPINAEIASQKRIAAVRKLCGTEHPQIAIDALANAWSEDHIKAEIRASVAEANAVNNPVANGFSGFSTKVKGISDNDQLLALEAGIAHSMGLADADISDPYHGFDVEQQRAYQSRAVRPIEAKIAEAGIEEYGNFQLQQFTARLADMENKQNRQGWRGEQTVHAAFSTQAFSKIYQALIERTLLANIRRVQPKWREIASPMSVPNFLTQEYFRVWGTGRWQKLNCDGEVPHGTMRECPSVKGRIHTEGQMLMICREDYLNDTLGALTNVAEGMAFYGNMSPEFAMWETLQNHPFSEVNGNLFTGAQYAFGYAALEKAHDVFCGMTEKKLEATDETDIFLDIDPALLVGPRCNGWMTMAGNLTSQTEFVLRGGANDDAQLTSTTNRFKDMFKVVATNYLNSQPNAWYMLADPSVLPAFRAGFLNGRQRPTISLVQPRPELLGAGIVGYHDFGFWVENDEAIKKFDSDTEADKNPAFV